MDETSAPMTDLERDTLALHASGRPGKIEIIPSKPLATQRDLSLAYSPGVAFPVCASPRIRRSPTITRSRAIWWR
jgi:malic enzyme